MLGVDPELVQVVGQWVQKAENDLQNAAHTLKLGRIGPTDTVCFHAQQCVEKYLKALLIYRELDFPKTHDLDVLLTRLPARVQLDLTVDEQAQLTRYATVMRYPGDYTPISLAEARSAVQIARRVRRQVRKWLPKEALNLPKTQDR